MKTKEPAREVTQADLGEQATGGTAPADARRFYVTDMGSVIDGEGYIVVADADVFEEEDLELIVHRANNFEALLAALKVIESRANGAQLQPHAGDGPVPEFYACQAIAQWASEAIAKAEGR